MGVVLVDIPGLLVLPDFISNFRFRFGIIYLAKIFCPDFRLKGGAGKL